MSSKRNKRRQSCTGKHRHETKEAALHEARRLSRKLDYPMWAYHCDWCNGYHVGHRNHQTIRASRQRSRK